MSEAITMDDALVVGAGPAGLAIAAALCEAGLRVAGLAPRAPDAPWPNTYGIWCDELAPLGLLGLLGHRWEAGAVFLEDGALPLGRAYGLLDNARLQAHLLGRCERGGVAWHRGTAAAAEHLPAGTQVRTRTGEALAARVVVDASGHRPALVRRPGCESVAYQAAYGMAGAFARPPVAEGRLVLMDYRADHLPPTERAGPPTFLYAMDLGGGRFFVEETSLARAPAVPLQLLERRLRLRLAAIGATPREVERVERCRFPMNPPLPHRGQPALAFGAAAGMVHPASGYQVGTALQRAPEVARAVARALGAAGGSPRAAALAGWQALWPRQRVRRRGLYLLGLASLLRMDAAQLQVFFHAFFRLPRQEWAGYLSDRLSTPQLLGVMLRLFGHLPGHLRATLLDTAWRERSLLVAAI